jgi:hypothetical protein
MIVAFYSIFLPFYLYSRINTTSEITVSGEAALITTSFIMAFSYDLLFRSFGTTYDLSQILIYFPIQLLFVIILIGLIIWQLRQPDHTTTNTREATISEIKEMTKTSRISGVFTIAGIGALLFLQHTLLMNPYNLLRWAVPQYFLLDLSLTLIITLTMLLLSAILLLHPKLRKYYASEKWHYLILYNLLLIIPLGLLFLIGGWFFIIFVLIFQIVIIFDLFLLIRYAIHPSLRWSPVILCTAIFVGFIIFLLWDFMFAFTFTHAYLGDIGTLFAGQAFTIVLTAALILLGTSTYAAFKLGRSDT